MRTAIAVSTEVDARLLGRPPKFDGAEAHWPDWSSQLRAYAETMGDDMGAQLDTIEAAPDRALTLGALSAEVQANSRRLYYVLARLLSGGPLLLPLKKRERGNGLECWRQTVLRCEARIRGCITCLALS